jgi:transketolase
LLQVAITIYCLNCMLIRQKLSKSLLRTMSTKRSSVSSSSAAKKAKNESISDELANKCINNIRVLSADTVGKAKSGHPGAPMGCAPMAHLLWGEFMNFNASHPKWSNRDRFVLSNGHACALLYSMLHLSGYELSVEDLQNFRQLGSQTPGHPENFVTPGVEVSTGPLGQGISNAVGLAMAERHLAATFNRDEFDVVDHYTYVICGDGCLQEGVSSEASSLAGHLGLGKLIVLYDDNLITIDGGTNLSFTEDVNMRYESYGWHTQTVGDVSDLTSMRNAIANAKAETGRPSMIKIRTVIGHGSTMEGSHKVHGAPLSADDLGQLKTKYGFDPTASFAVLPEVKELYSARGRSDGDRYTAWQAMFAAYASAHPELAADFDRRENNALPADWKSALPSFPFAEEKKAIGTRNHSQLVLNGVAGGLPELMGGSADLTPSNLTNLTCSGDFQADTPAGRYIRFGVREHGMAAICNGMFAHGGVRPFCATFLNFIGYAMGSVRLSALSRFGVIYVMTHDSIGLGEDGPTHQPIETLEMLRATPNLLTFRPCDGNEVAGSYICAVEHTHTPSVISLSRQTAPALPHSSTEKVAQGAYTISEAGAGPCKLIIASTGTEVQLAIKVAEAVATSAASVRVVSMPCWELFERQSIEYQLEVFPAGVPVMSVEAAGAQGWTKYAHAPYGMSSFGCSAPGGKVYERFGFTVENLSICAQEVMNHYKDCPAESLINRVRFEIGGGGH